MNCHRTSTPINESATTVYAAFTAPIVSTGIESEFEELLHQALRDDLAGYPLRLAAHRDKDFGVSRPRRL